MNFFEEISKETLNRNKDTGFFTTNNPSLDKFLSFDNTLFYGTPTDEAIKTAGGVSAILSMLGYKTTAFTATTIGLLINMKNKSKNVLIFGSNLKINKDYLISIIISAIDEYNLKNNNKQSKDFLDKLKNNLLNQDQKSINFAQIAIDLGSVITKEYSKLESNMIEGYNSLKRIDDQNCNLNDVVILNYIEECLDVTRDQAKEIFAPLFIKLIDDYKIYNSGKDKTILAHALISKFEDLHILEYAIANANACSTDYIGADLVLLYETALTTNTKQKSADISHVESRIRTPKDLIKINMEATKKLNNYLFEKHGKYRMSKHVYTER